MNRTLAQVLPALARHVVARTRALFQILVTAFLVAATPRHAGRVAVVTRQRYLPTYLITSCHNRTMEATVQVDT